MGIAYYIINLFSYKLSVTEKIGGIELHTLSLGEYFTPVEELRISDNMGNDIVKFIAKSEKSAMHTVTVDEGVNSFKDMYLEGYDISYSRQIPYQFVGGHKYTAKVKWPYSRR